MKHFDYITAAKGLLTPRTTTLLSAIHEAKGRQSVQAAIRPDLLNTLIAVARIQSTNASNRIEGISTSDKRLNALVAGKTTPHNRAEEEITGYRDVLATIHESHDYIPPTPKYNPPTASRSVPIHRPRFRRTFQRQRQCHHRARRHRKTNHSFHAPKRTHHTGAHRARLCRLYRSHPRRTYRSIARHSNVHLRLHLHPPIQ